MGYKKYEAIDDIVGLSVVKGQVFTQAGNGYIHYSVDTLVENGTEKYNYTRIILPAHIVENDFAFRQVNEPKEVAKSSTPEVEKEVSIEEVKKELQDDEVIEPLVKKLKVVLSFPGGKEGEIFEYNKEANAYLKQTPVDEDEYISALLNGSVSALTVAEVNDNFDYFEDITPKVMKTKEEIMMKIADLAEQKMGYEKLIEGSENKILVNKAKKQIQIINKTIEALEWSCGEGRDFIVDLIFNELSK